MYFGYLKVKIKKTTLFANEMLYQNVLKYKVEIQYNAHIFVQKGVQSTW